MKTFLTKSPEEAAEFIRRGRTVAFPTETVYGLGARVFDEEAIAAIFRAKDRPADNPLIAHIGDLQQIYLLATTVSASAQKFIDAFFPGPLTLVMPKAKAVPLIATAGLETIGVRMPQNILAREFLKFCKTPVVAPSANLSGRPSPTTWQAVFEDLNGRIDCILKGETTVIGLESTVLDCTSDIPLILRTGAVTLEQLRRIEPKTEQYESQPDENPRSPGLRHRHYSPKAKVVLETPGAEFGSRAFIGINKPAGGFDLIKICDSPDDYAHSVFEFFRRCDRAGIEVIYCETVDEEGIGLALMDRLRRAAG